VTAFYATAPFSLVEEDRRFRGAYCLSHQGDSCQVFLAYSIAGRFQHTLMCSYGNEVAWTYVLFCAWYIFWNHEPFLKNTIKYNFTFMS
jgi:hypothetical protein